MSGRYRQSHPLELGRYRRNIAKDVVLTLLTCGIYGLVWKRNQLKGINILLDEDKYSWWFWLIASVLTCGIYNLYHVYVLSRDIVALENEYGVQPSTHLPLICIIVSLFGFVIAAEALMQNELNYVIDKALAGGDRR